MLRYDIEDGLLDYLSDNGFEAVKTVMATEHPTSGVITLIVLLDDIEKYGEGYYSYFYYKEALYNADKEKDITKNEELESTILMYFGGNKNEHIS